ncbi:MAG: single-stranded-DNA-specific exonuclease RecJ [Eubacterium sp.]|nr:single-stranded-DNA-specific exonuclease RecJ [Eubacterium sp.]
MEINRKIIELLHRRGLTTPEEIEEFLSDKPKETYDPFLLPDMEDGVDLILSCCDRGDKICIYGDYDADGVTSTVIMTEVLSQLTDNIIQYIPSRFDEGYGLNKAAIDTIKKAGADLIVTVDCGSVSVDEVEYAKSIGLEIMVTDHHRIEDRQADTILINPARKDSEYPFPYLAGCGVAFKLAQALTEAAGLEKKVLTRMLDLVAIGTIGDIVPLIGENRMLVKYGLRAINTSEREPLRVLIEKTGLRPGEVKCENVSFVLVPHINAAGRMRSAVLALKLFLAKDREKMESCADDLVQCNAERKRLQNEVFERACEQVDEKYGHNDFLLVDLPDAHEGVAGIAAGKLKEKYYRPSVIVTDNGDGMLKGTGRSPEGIDLYKLLKNEEKWFGNFGGHAAACGFTMKKEGLEEVRRDLNRIAGEIKKEDPELFDGTPVPDIELDPEEVTVDFASQLELLEPCGRMNERPLVSVSGIPCNITRMGTDGKYIRFSLRQTSCTFLMFREAEEKGAIVYSAAESGRAIRVVGNMFRHEWNGSTYVQIVVEDVSLI